jgi:hypothetical protein
MEQQQVIFVARAYPAALLEFGPLEKRDRAP